MGFEGESRCLVVSVIRDACPLPAPYEQTVLQAHDLVVLYGDHASLERAVKRFQ